MSDTANFESAQALFCAIADNVGKTNINKILDLETYETYPAFVATHKKVIDDVYKSGNLDVDVNRQTIEKFLTKQKSWYISSVKIAKKLINDLATKVDRDFADIIEPGFQRNYIRGDKDVVGNIEKLYNAANANTKKNIQLMKIEAFGNLNKWSPADIYYASDKAKKDIDKELTNNAKKTSYAFPALNTFISKLINSGDLLPLSLKKATTEVKIVPVNFNITARTKLIDGIYPKGSKKIEGGLWCRKDQKGATGFESFKKFPETGGVSNIKKETKQSGIPKEYGEPASKTELDKIPSSSFQISVSGNSSRSSETGYIQMRHDRSGASWKVDYNPTVGEGRGGSVVSDSLFTQLLKFVDPKVATAFQSAYTSGNTAYRKKRKELDVYKDRIRKLNIDSKSNSKDDGISLFQNPKRTSYDYVRGEISSIEVTNKVNDILQTWFKENNNTDGDKVNKVDDFIRILFRYVTSRSDTSAKFVIAKS